MTSFASGGSRDVCAGLALSGLAIVARGATGSHTGVIHLGTQEAGGGLMASLARGSSRDVGSRFAFSGRAIVARGATGGDTSVIHLGTEE